MYFLSSKFAGPVRLHALDPAYNYKAIGVWVHDRRLRYILYPRFVSLVDL